MARSSNRERIARAAEEARLAALEKAAKKVAKKPSSGTKRSATPVRVKIVWEACSAAGAVLGTFAYPDKLAAQAKVAMLTRTTGRTHVLREARVPMV